MIQEESQIAGKGGSFASGEQDLAPALNFRVRLDALVRRLLGLACSDSVARRRLKGNYPTNSRRPLNQPKYVIEWTTVKTKGKKRKTTVANTGNEIAIPHPQILQYQTKRQSCMKRSEYRWR